MGLSVSSQIHAQKMAEFVEPLEGSKIIADDVIIYGRGNSDQEAQADHDRNLRALLDRCRKFDVRLNKEILKVNCSTIKFWAHLLTLNGLKIDPEKVKAITEAPQPTCKDELRQLLGAATFLARYMPNFSSVTEKLRELTYEKMLGYGILPCIR